MHVFIYSYMRVCVQTNRYIDIDTDIDIDEDIELEKI